MDLSERGADTVGARHPWEVARARFFRGLLSDAGVLSRRQAVLDVGAGDTYVARALLDALPPGSEVTCVDDHYSDEDLRRYTVPSLPGLSLARQPPPDRGFDLILLLDVIEHVADDRALLAGLVARHLAPGGLVLISVPAWQGLFGAHDVALRHFRRYSPAACRAVIAATGLSVRASGGLFHTLLAPRAVAVARQALLGRGGAGAPDASVDGGGGDAAGSTAAAATPTAAPSPAETGGRGIGAWRAPRLLSAAIDALLAADNALSRLAARRRWPLPGLSFWALCAAPGPPPPPSS